MLAYRLWLIFQGLKSHNFVTAQCNATKLCTLLATWTSGVKQIKIAESMGVLQTFVQNYLKYTNMEGFCRDNHKW